MPPPLLGGGSEPCALCSGRVYPAERILTSAGTLFHLHCFRCTSCKRQLHRSTYCQDGPTGRLYCKPHYSQLAARAGLEQMASMGVDPSAGVLWRKRAQKQGVEELEALQEGGAVWVDLSIAPSGTEPRRGGISRRTSATATLVGVADYPPAVHDIANRLGADLSMTPFLRAVVVSMAREKRTVTVRSVEGDDPRSSLVADVAHRSVALRDSGIGPEVSNLDRLSYLNEANLLGTIQARFRSDRIYTYTGSLELLALNPYAPVGRYDEDTMALWRDSSNVAQDAKEGPDPHVFGVAERIWRELVPSTGRVPGAPLVRSHSVVVSGESGAGKTESNRHVLAYLRWRARGADRTGHLGAKGSLAGYDSGSGGARIDLAIGISHSVLEAFGNASTAFNHNSSRFGKYLAVHIGVDGELLCGSFSVYLLEKTRVVRRSGLDHNFHSFYVLCAAATGCHLKPVLAALQLRPADRHTYIGSGSGNHSNANVSVDTPATEGFGDRNEAALAARFAEVDNALKRLSKYDELVEPSFVWGVVSAILHLGDVRFRGEATDGVVEVGSTNVGGDARGPSFEGLEDDVDADDDTEARVGARDLPALRLASELLGVGESTLRSRLTERILSAGAVSSREELVVVPLSRGAAARARDALSTTLYSALFTRLVSALNALMLPHRSAGSVTGESGARSEPFIGLLDIFGFESLEHNSLEQLLINYANERLHALFLCHVFLGMSDDTVRILLNEDGGFGTDGFAAGEQDNGAALGVANVRCVSLIDAPPKGVLHLLDHQCRAPAGSESAFCLAVNQKHEVDDFLIVPKLSRNCKLDASSGFVIRHFAGDVAYAAGSFLQSNNDTLVGGSQWLAKSSNPLVRDLFSPSSADAPPLLPGLKSTAQTLSTGGFSSVGGRFSANLTELCTLLSSTKTHYIRCMKPNAHARPRHFDPRHVCSRLRAAGSLSALRFMRKLRDMEQDRVRIHLSTLMRLGSTPHAESLPEELTQLQDPIAFARALLDVCDVPPALYEFVGDTSGSSTTAGVRSNGNSSATRVVREWSHEAAGKAADNDLYVSGPAAVVVSAALVPFLAAMESDGTSADAEAARCVAQRARIDSPSVLPTSKSLPSPCSATKDSSGHSTSLTDSLTHTWTPTKCSTHASPSVATPAKHLPSPLPVASGRSSRDQNMYSLLATRPASDSTRGAQARPGQNFESSSLSSISSPSMRSPDATPSKGGVQSSASTRRATPTDSVGRTFMFRPGALKRSASTENPFSKGGLDTIHQPTRSTAGSSPATEQDCGKVTSRGVAREPPTDDGHFIDTDASPSPIFDKEAALSRHLMSLVDSTRGSALGQTNVLPVLNSMLEAGDAFVSPNIRAGVVVAIGRLHQGTGSGKHGSPPECITMALEHDPAATVRAAAVAALAGLDAPYAMLPALRDPQWLVRLAAAQEYTKIMPRLQNAGIRADRCASGSNGNIFGRRSFGGGPDVRGEVMEALMPLLADSERRVRRAAALALSAMGDAHWEAVFPDSTGPPSFEALSSSTRPETLDLLIDLLTVTHAEDRRMAAQILGLNRNTPNTSVNEGGTVSRGHHSISALACAGLRVAARDVDAGVREQALHSIGEVRDVSSLELIISSLTDRSPRVRYAAVLAAGKLGDLRALPAVLARLGVYHHKQPETVPSALANTDPAWGNGRIDPEAMTTPYNRLAEVEHEAVAAAAAATLHQLESPESLNALVELLLRGVSSQKSTEATHRFQRAIVASLSRWSDPAAVLAAFKRAAVFGRASVRAKDIRAAACEVLGHLFWAGARKLPNASSTGHNGCSTSSSPSRGATGTADVTPPRARFPVERAATAPPSLWASLAARAGSVAGAPSPSAYSGDREAAAAFALMLPALNDSDEAVRVAATWAIGKLGFPHALAHLVPSLKEPSAVVGDAAASAISLLDWSAFLEPGEEIVLSGPVLRLGGRHSNSSALLAQIENRSNMYNQRLILIDGKDLRPISVELNPSGAAPHEDGMLRLLIGGRPAAVKPLVKTQQEWVRAILTTWKWQAEAIKKRGHV